MSCDDFEKITNDKQWLIKAQKIIKESSISPEYKTSFHAYWTVAAHQIRGQISNDKLLVSMLSIALPKYTGPNTLLYRGENLFRWKSGNLGFCWSSNIETVKMFARGLNATKTGGILLKCYVPSKAILAGPSEHSNYLGESEFTVNPYGIPRGIITVVETYPHSD